MAGHPRDVEHSDMVVSQKKISYVVYFYPRSEASWHQYWCVPRTTHGRYGESLEWRGAYVGSISAGVFHAKSNHICLHPWCSRGLYSIRETKGKRGCPICVDGTALIYLSSFRKLVFMQHWRFLERKYKYRKMKRYFDNTVEKESAPKWYTGKLLFEMVKNILVIFGEGTVKG
jgi:hypothetical protein